MVAMSIDYLDNEKVEKWKKLLSFTGEQKQ